LTDDGFAWGAGDRPPADRSEAMKRLIVACAVLVVGISMYAWQACADVRAYYDPVGRYQYFWDNDVSPSTAKILTLAGVVFEDDFIGYATGNTTTNEFGDGWAFVEVGSNTNIVGQSAASGAHGTVMMSFDGVDEAKDAVLYLGDMLSIPVDQDAIFEARLRFPTLPSSGTTVVWGMASGHNLDNDTIARSAWFRMDINGEPNHAIGTATGKFFVEADDGTNEIDNASTTTAAIVANEWHTYTIDFADLSDLKFKVDGVDVTYATATSISIANASNSTALLQPYISMDTGAETGAAQAKMELDFVRVYARRQP